MPSLFTIPAPQLGLCAASRFARAKIFVSQHGGKRYGPPGGRTPRGWGVAKKAFNGAFWSGGTEEHRKQASGYRGWWTLQCVSRFHAKGTMESNSKDPPPTPPKLLASAKWTAILSSPSIWRVGEKSLQGFPLCRVKCLNGLSEICQIGRNCAGFCARQICLIM